MLEHLFNSPIFAFSAMYCPSDLHVCYIATLLPCWPTKFFKISNDAKYTTLHDCWPVCLLYKIYVALNELIHRFTNTSWWVLQFLNVWRNLLTVWRNYLRHQKLWYTSCILNLKGLAKLILGFLACFSLKMVQNKRHETVQSILSSV